MLRAIVFIAMIAPVSASESLNARSMHRQAFQLRIAQQLASVQGEQSPDGIRRKDDFVCGSENGLFQALRTEMPEMMKIAMGMEARPPKLETFAAAFAVAGEDQEESRAGISGRRTFDNSAASNPVVSGNLAMLRVTADGAVFPVRINVSIDPSLKRKECDFLLLSAPQKTNRPICHDRKESRRFCSIQSCSS
jgi:hypothetical protein